VRPAGEGYEPGRACRPGGGDDELRLAAGKRCAAPEIDLATRLALALGVRVAELLPTSLELDDLDVMRRQARKLFDELVGSEDRAVLLLTQVLTRLSEAGYARLRKALYLPALTAIRQAPHRLSTTMRRFRNGDGIQ
jgi:hypothetical protein